MDTPVVVEFPLRGEWTAPNTPGKKVPSHGTDMLGQRFAYDFVRTDAKTGGMRFYGSSPLRYFTFGVPLQDCFGWGQPIHSPADGTVVKAEDGWPERNPVHLVRDLGIAIKNGLTTDPARIKDLRSLAGNYIILEIPGAFAFLAHAQTGSIKVSPGEKVSTGQHLANVGHSGNTTAPHLHFQLADDQDLLVAKGIPCCFREYEIFQEGAWRIVQNGIPKDTDRIRKL